MLLRVIIPIVIWLTVIQIFCSGQAYMLVFNKEGSNGDGPDDGVTMCAGTYTYGDAFVVGSSPHE